MRKIPQIEVGILSAERVRFLLNGKFRVVDTHEVLEGEATITADDAPFSLEPIDYSTASFDLFDVSIGIRFHWERKEQQRFRGTLKFIVLDNVIQAINILPLEDYLTSVISSEMNARSSLELLKAHAVISRSWLLAQQHKKLQVKQTDYQSILETSDEYVRWYDREDHTHFDVCADDHCQRYQGITKVTTESARKAVEDTLGEVLMFDRQICDTRFSKCCGGISENFEHVWEPVVHPYLTKVVDNKDSFPDSDLDLTREDNAQKWIVGTPKAFCNTSDKAVLSTVLNDYDQETQRFYRWTEELTQEKIAQLLQTNTGADFGRILDLIPIERGVSGRLVKLKIIGSKKILTIGKELFIRKSLSDSHLYSAAFVVIKEYGKDPDVPSKFILKGAGWGHGVGLCQIGAAVMADKGYSYKEILSHYFPGAKLTTL